VRNLAWKKTIAKPLLFRQPLASYPQPIKSLQFRHHFSLKFSLKIKPLSAQELPKIITHVTRIFTSYFHPYLHPKIKKLSFPEA